MKSVKNDKLLYVDCDDSLILWNLSKYPKFPKVTINTVKGPCILAVHKKNINLLIKFAKLGYGIVLWSGSGYRWAEKVAKAVGIDQYVDIYLCKPQYYLDDFPCQYWMGTRIYRDPVTGIDAYNKVQGELETESLPEKLKKKKK